MIIGVTGHIGSGKNEVGKVLEHFGYRQVALADTLKTMALALDPIVETYHFPKHPERLRTVVGLLGWEKAKANPEVRRLLQRLGTEAGREILGESVWISALQTRMASLLATDNVKDFVVTDVRFPNEADWIRDLNGQVWKVLRQGCNGDRHASERGVGEIDADVYITNDGTLEELWQRVVAVMPQ